MAALSFFPSSALAQMICASLTEDKYGIVQRDIPCILEAFMTFLNTIEEHQEELRNSAPPDQLISREEFGELERALEALSVVSIRTSFLAYS
jgi:hypothetical protein